MKQSLLTIQQLWIRFPGRCTRYIIIFINNNAYPHDVTELLFQDALNNNPHPARQLQCILQENIPSFLSSICCFFDDLKIQCCWIDFPNLDYIVWCSAETLNYLAFQYFDFDHVMKVTSETRRVHCIRSLHFVFRNCKFQ
jgi:hypothetical protein